MGSTNKKTQDILQELSELDKKLEGIQTFFRNAKSTDTNDSLLTKNNIQESISLLKKINPSEKHMINALTALIPLAENQTKKLPQTTPTANTKLTSNSAENYNQWTPKLKSKVPLNRVI